VAKVPPQSEQIKIVIYQRGLCIYCWQPLDGFIWRHGRSIDLELNWDHAVPFSYLGCSPVDNWVASCQICNQIKSDFIFEDMNSARNYIQMRRDKLGYTTIAPTWGNKDSGNCPYCGHYFKNIYTFENHVNHRTIACLNAEKESRKRSFLAVTKRYVK
jgi:5-methylcytosine-specific restriction endonuclease McrA